MRIWLAILLLALGLAAVKAMPAAQQIIIFGTQTTASAPPLTNLRITNAAAFRTTNTGANRAVSP